MPYINISLYKGQTKEKKADIAKKITMVIKEELSVPDDKIWVTYTDIPKADWAIGGELSE